MPAAATHVRWMLAFLWWLVAGGWWLVADGWWPSADSWQVSSDVGWWESSHVNSSIDWGFGPIHGGLGERPLCCLRDTGEL